MDRRELLKKSGRAARLGAQASVSLAADARARWQARRHGGDPDAVARSYAAHPESHVSLDDLPPEIAHQLDFDDAAPQTLPFLKSVPPEVRAALRDLWNGVIADIYDEVKIISADRHLHREHAERVAGRVVVRIEESQKAMVLAGTIQPLPWDDARRHVRSAALGVGSATGAAAVATYGGFVVGASVGVAAVIVSECFETYVAASARTHQYRAVGRDPGPEVIAMDIATALGQKTSIGIPAEGEFSRTAMKWLAKFLVEKTVKRILRMLVPIVGVAVNATSAHRDIRKVTSLPLRPPAPGEGTHHDLFGETWPAPGWDAAPGLPAGPGWSATPAGPPPTLAKGSPDLRKF